MSSNSNFVTSLGKIQIHLQQVLLLLSNMQYVYRNIKSTRRHTRITTTNRMWISVWQTIPWDKVNVVRTKRNIQDPRSVTRQRSYQVALHTANTHNMQPFISSSFHVQTTQATGVWGRLLVSKNQASMSITRQSDGGWREEGQWVTSLVREFPSVQWHKVGSQKRHGWGFSSKQAKKENWLTQDHIKMVIKMEVVVTISHMNNCVICYTFISL